MFHYFDMNYNGNICVPGKCVSTILGTAHYLAAWCLFQAGEDFITIYDLLLEAQDK